MYKEIEWPIPKITREQLSLFHRMEYAGIKDLGINYMYF